MVTYELNPYIQMLIDKIEHHKAAEAELQAAYDDLLEKLWLLLDELEELKKKLPAI